MQDQKGNLLIVDDEAGIRKLLCRSLSKEGYSCEDADNTELALSKLRMLPIQMVILDIKMPGKSGSEFLPEIKSGFPEIAVIMATAVNDISIAIDCIRQGADDYICKPFNLDEVSLCVQRAMEKRQLQLKIKEYQKHLEDKVEAQTVEIRELFLGAIEALVFALEAKDKYTAGHSRRVAEIAVAIGREMDFPSDDIEDLHWGGLLHDVGKIAVDQSIQNKPGRLTTEEYDHIMIHAHVGAGIVQPVVNSSVISMIEHHHDHYDGSGLHQTSVGDDIPLPARILAVADAFDAITSERPYRAARSVSEAVEEIERCSGTQFDPGVVAAFLKTAFAKAAPAKGA